MSSRRLLGSPCRAGSRQPGHPLIFAGHRLDYSELERWVHIGYERGRTARGDIHAGPRPPAPR